MTIRVPDTVDGLTIVCDTREKQRLPIDGMVIQTLGEGDYSEVSLLDVLRIERKEIGDLFGSCGRESARFTRELQRLTKYRWRHLVIEASLEDIVRRPPAHTRMLPKAVVARLVQWSLRYGLHVWFCGSPRFTAALVVRLVKAARRELAREAAEPDKGRVDTSRGDGLE